MLVAAPVQRQMEKRFGYNDHAKQLLIALLLGSFHALKSSCLARLVEAFR